MSHFLGLVGLINSVLLLPLFFILNSTGVEPFEWPNRDALYALTLNAILGTVISDYCWAKAVVHLGPLIVTLGIALTIPVSMVVDSFYESKKFTPLYYVGTALILTGFVGNSIKDYMHQQKK